jgi:dihydrodipicolinate synthase/N-acetylneuraminate lyase
MEMKWAGVMPATTTAFDGELNIDHEFVARHAEWLIDHGCTGIVTPGSLGESATLSLACTECGGGWLQWLDGVAAVCLPQ